MIVAWQWLMGVTIRLRLCDRAMTTFALPMRIAYLDCFSGVSGDMFLGALVDAGVPAKLFEDTVTALKIGAHLQISRVHRSGITATKVDVYVHGEKDLPREIFLGAFRNFLANSKASGNAYSPISTLGGCSMTILGKSTE